MEHILVGILLIPVTTLLLFASTLSMQSKLSEAWVSSLSIRSLFLSWIISFFLWSWMFVTRTPIEADVFQLVSIRGYELSFHLHFDWIGGTYICFSLGLGFLIAYFSRTYLHREEGFNRFYFYLFIALIGIELISLGEGLDVILIGWELVGISSALLIAFYFERKTPLDNSLKAYRAYRTTDIGIVMAVILMHHTFHSSALTNFSMLREEHLITIPLLIIFGSMGKGALFPFTYWLPKAMEGPTPSSAVFYGALSVHLSPLLLIRCFSNMKELPQEVFFTLIAIGLITALYASWIGRIQSDIKSVVGYATIAQIGIIWIEIAFGLHVLALIHMIGNASLRTVQLLRAPSLLHDRQHIIHSKRANFSPTGVLWGKITPLFLQRTLYFWGIQKDLLQETWDGGFGIFGFILKGFHKLEQSWISLLEEPETEKEER